MVACGPRLVIVGSTDPSTTHSPSTPRTRHCGSTTASPSRPIGAVPDRCWEVDQDTGPNPVVAPINSRTMATPERSRSTSPAAVS
ncbi:hypothetical protein BHQ18_08345 [Mycolicibacterium flavescens]|uniref:Uncharacterized protein n=1 Tax=Mycolicibacterium flavescens TaxID=1776 RepID=A0A1E3RLJ8_MYCFV|nr:hypothetical protein BHQ18_08345 [Mycolicibacterium flavescens]